MAERPTAGAALLGSTPRRLLVAATFVLAALAAAVAYSLLAEKRYDARAHVLVTPLGDDPAFVGLSLLRDSPGGTRAVETAGRLTETREIADAVAVRLRGTDGDELLESVDARPAGEGDVLVIEAHAPEGERAAQIANGFADELVARRSARFQSEVTARIARLRAQLGRIPAARRDTREAVSLQEQLAHLTPLVGRRDPTLQVVGDAVAPRDAAWPRPWAIVPVVGLGALLLALAALGLSEVVRRRGAKRGESFQPDDPESVQRFAAEAERRLVARLEPLLRARSGAPEVTPPQGGRAHTEQERLARARAGDLAAKERQLQARERELTDRSAAFERRERELDGRAAKLDERIAALTSREQALARRVAELSAVEARPPTPPEPTAGRPHARAGRWNLSELEHLVAEHSGQHPDRIDEWSAYLFSLREHAEADGSLPSSFDHLIVEVFGEEVLGARGS